MIRSLLGLISLDAGQRPGPGHGHPHAPARRSARRSASSPRTSACSPGWSASQFVAYAGELVGMRPQRRTAAGPRGARLRRAGRGPLPPGRVVLDRDEAAAQDRLGHRARPAAPDPRRADQRHGPGGPRRGPASWPATWPRNKGMSLLFSSHLLPDVEAVCDHVMVLGRGRLLAQGRIDELKQPHDRQFEVRVKGDQRRLRRPARGAGHPGRAAATITCWSSCPAGDARASLWETAPRGGRAGPAVPAAAEHPRRSLPRAPWRNRTDADLRPGIPALATGSSRATPGGGWPITRQGVRAQLKNRWVWLVSSWPPRARR